MTAGRNRRRHYRAKDPYVRQAQQSGWRSRAVFKLSEIDRREHLFRPGMHVLDLGAAPGGWSQYAVSRVSGGRIAAVDLHEMQPLPGVGFVRGDVRRAEVLECASAFLGGRVDLVMSDMSPNISGIASVDIPCALALAEIAGDVAGDMLTDGGVLLVKLFHGEGFDEYLAKLKCRCVSVVIRKPAASRSESREVYVLARF